MAKDPLPIELTIDQRLRVRAYAAGFQAGADTSGLARRHRVDPRTHAHWLKGYRRGRVEAKRAVGAYALEIAVDEGLAELAAEKAGVLR